MQLAVIIPAFDEGQSLGRVLERMPKSLPDIEHIHVFVVDDGSTDGTGDSAAAHGATVLRHGKRRGLASAFRTGLKAAVDSGADLIATVDADGQYDPAELVLLLERLKITGADLVVGDRQVRGLQHMPAENRIGNIIGSMMLRAVGLTQVRDASSGFRLFTAALARSLKITSRHTYTHEMLIQASAWGFAATDVPITFHARRHGQSKLVRSLKNHILRSCGTIFRSLFLYRPLPKFLFAAGVLLTGSILSLMLALESDSSSLFLTAFIFLVLALQFSLVGAVADIGASERRLAAEERRHLPRS